LRSSLPDLDAARLERALRGGRRTFVMGGLTPQVRSKVYDLGLPGVSFEPEQRRVYPLGYTGAHLVGFVDGGGEGLAGAEGAFNDEIHQLASGDKTMPLAMDLRIQAAAEDELYKSVAQFRPKGAVAVVVNVHSGEILALANYPTFNPNEPGRSSLDARLNRAAAAIYEMGSTFKGFTVAIGLDTGVATPMSTYDARQPFHIGYRTINDFHATHKVLTLVEVFQHSSNIGTARLAEQIGPTRMGRYYAALGLTQPAKVELMESARPLTPKVWDEDAVASTSFGFGINVSPLAVTRAYVALANGGKLVPLTIRKLPPGAKVDGPQVVSPRTTEQLLQIMRANVTGGSGKSANVPGLSVGGKTGTGEKYDPAIRGYSKTKQVSSFAATFPNLVGCIANLLTSLTHVLPGRLGGLRKRAAGLVADLAQRSLDLLPSLACLLLHEANQLIEIAFHLAQLVIGELAPLLLYLALQLIPVPHHFFLRTHFFGSKRTKYTDISRRATGPIADDLLIFESAMDGRHTHSIYISRYRRVCGTP